MCVRVCGWTSTILAADVAVVSAIAALAMYDVGEPSRRLVVVARLVFSLRVLSRGRLSHSLEVTFPDAVHYSTAAGGTSLPPEYCPYPVDGGTAAPVENPPV